MSRFTLNFITVVVTLAVGIIVILPVWYACRTIESTSLETSSDGGHIYRIQLPTRIVPSFGGGYTIQHSNPTEFPTQVRPDGMGGFIAQQLGHQPTYIRPDFNGGYTIYQPFHHQIMPPARLNDDNDGN